MRLLSPVDRRPTCARAGLAALWLAASLAAASLVASSGPAFAQSFPPGFNDELVVSGLNIPTTLAFAPNDRIFVGEQDGAIRIVDSGVLLPTPAITLNVEPFDEQGLLDLALDPNYPTDPYLYAFYTPFSGNETGNTSRVSRFTVTGDSIAAASEFIVLDSIPGGLGFHLGGCIRFASDQTLYVSTGDTGWAPPYPQDTTRLEGKMLRVNKDGTIPGDNPLVGVAGAREEIWQWGLRNPFRFTLQPGTDLPFIADVGFNSWEELNSGPASANFGWPQCEGSCGNPGVTNPVYAYPHDGMDSAIVGCDFYSGTMFPAQYVGNLFFFDHARGHLGRIELGGSNQVQTVEFPFLEVASQGWLAGPVDLREGPDGALYYCTYVPGQVRRITYTGAGNRNPTALASANPTAGSIPLLVNFDGTASFDIDGDPITYEWDFGDGSPVSTDSTPSYTYTAGGTYSATLTVRDGQGGSATATPLTITAGNLPPLVTISLPLSTELFLPNETIDFAGSASDPEDGPLPGSSLTWTVNLHHNEHIHPIVLGQSGSSGAFLAESHGESLLELFYRVTLEAEDSNGLTTTASVDVLPDPASGLPNTQTFFVPANDRDATSVNSDVRLSGFSGTDPNVYVSNDSDAESAGLQFALPIPSGAAIQSAILTVTAGGFASPSATGAMVIHLYDVGDAQPFVGGSMGDLIGHHPLYPIPVDWPAPPAWDSDTEYTAPDLAALVQAWVDRPDHAPGQHFGLVVTEGTLPSGRYYGWNDFAAGPAPSRLTVTWLELPTNVGSTPAGAIAFRSPWPNPFRSGTLLRFEGPAAHHTTVQVFDVQGRLIRRLAEGTAYPMRTVAWDGTNETGQDVPAGVYFVRIESGAASASRRVVKLR